MKRTLLIAAALAAILGFRPTATAIPVTGSISFSGDADLRLGAALSTVASADRIDFASGLFNATVTSVSAGGSYSGVSTGVGGQQALFFDLIFAPFTPLGTLWQFTTGSGGTAITYSMSASALTAPVQRNTAAFPNSLVLNGAGIATISGPGLGGTVFDPTPGFWNIVITEGQATFGFASSTVIPPPPVPDGGATLVLLGLALSGLGVLRKKLA